MRLHFEPNLDFQLEAIEAVCDLFRGQEICRTEFVITHGGSPSDSQLPFEHSSVVVPNRLSLTPDTLLENLAMIQARNRLPPATTLASRDFTVEMETGTGKTYVYLRTIFDLHRRYGFTKFIVVVPSVAIKEGVYKSLQIMETHFRDLYSGIPFEYYFYDSRSLGQVRSFASSSSIEIMIMTVGSINKKDINTLYKQSEKTGGERPIDFVKATQPILIVDEPQSVDGGLNGRGRQALLDMDPLCTLRYSATHVDRHHMLYRLDAVDAYDRHLVKQIEVASATVIDAHTQPYLRLIKPISRYGTVSAVVEIDTQIGGKVRRRQRTVQDGDDLEEITGRSAYSAWRIAEIRAAPGDGFLELQTPEGEHYLRPEEAYGDIDITTIHRQMMRRTIQEHLDKEKRLHSQGIKVLSLFFVDAVAKYRKYDTSGNRSKGEYALMFEEEYRSISRHPDYRMLFEGKDIAETIENVHEGYFSIDKRGSWTETAHNNQTNRENAERAYNLIMKDKEELLSFDTPLKFIFSHSALQEGWDNPNVFQICTLRDIRTERERRQTIGRGLRLCVDQRGERIRGFDVNTLTVVATESYEEFAENLQHEIEKETGIRFGVIEPHLFAVVTSQHEDNNTRVLGSQAADVLWRYFRDAGYIDAKGRIRESLRTALTEKSVIVPDEFSAYHGQIVAILQKYAGGIEVKNADERRSVSPRQAILHSAEFKALWERIRDKTTYRVSFDNEDLIAQCIKAMDTAPLIPRPRLQWETAEIAISQAGLQAREMRVSGPISLVQDRIELPDVLTELQNRTQLTRRSIQLILCGSGRLNDFRRNPQRFIETAAQAISNCKRRALVDGIKYQRLGDEYYYAQKLFEQNELIGYLKNMAVARKSVYEQVVYESQTESQFASELEANSAVKVYAKLPGWFKVPTPLGSYNPDWAVLVDSDDGERLYLVVETKGSIDSDDLRQSEDAKIACGRAHFNALRAADSSARYEVATSVDELLAAVAID